MDKSFWTKKYANYVFVSSCEESKFTEIKLVLR